ncbi:MAG: hypothetical protein CM1200mP29_02150 [Verrucomicrobiota bacterium]|nr:MAG: hypothetical protein CM1200mP29_02150 [Verrucomicrobiota bacterium]
MGTPAWASGSGQKEIVELLLVNGANVNATALSGKTALDYAVKAGHKEKPPICCANMAAKSELNCNLELNSRFFNGLSL